MKSLTTLSELFQNLSQNETSANASLGTQLINDSHRYLLQKFFNNERSIQTTTVGSMNLGITASLLDNATSATLDSAWAYPTNTQLVNFSNGDQRSVLFTFNSTAITWQQGLSSAADDEISTVGVQDYSIPANISKVKNLTISVGQLKFQPTPIQTRQEWDLINFLPYSSDIPNYYFIWNNKISIFPIPSTTANIIQMNYQTRVADLSFADYSTGTLDTGGMVAGSTTVTGLATNWLTTGAYPSGVDISYYNLYIKANPPYGDGIWYPIRQFNSNTELILNVPVTNAPNITAATTYTIGQFPLLEEDFHDMLVYRALMSYFSNIVQDQSQFQMSQTLYEEKLQMLEDYLGTKQVDVNLRERPQMLNANLFIFGN